MIVLLLFLILLCLIPAKAWQTIGTVRSVVMGLLGLAVLGGLAIQGFEWLTQLVRSTHANPLMLIAFLGVAGAIVGFINLSNET